MAEDFNIIEYINEGDVLIWRSPVIEFNESTKLVVREGQSAVIMINGKSIGEKTAGLYTLEDLNLPSLGFGDSSSYICEIYIVNTVVHMGLRWGCNEHLYYIDGNYNLKVGAGVNGILNIKVTDPVKLLKKLASNQTEVAWGARTERTLSLKSLLIPTITSKVAPKFSNYMETNKVGINELDKNLMELSAIFKTILEPDFENIGIELEEFLVRKINLIEDDPKFEKLKALYDSEFEDAVLAGGTRKKVKIIRSEQMIAEATGELQEDQQKNITSKTKAELERELLIAQAEADKIRILGQANAEIERIKNADKVPDSDKKLCKGCGKELLPNARFCLECGKKVEDEDTINCPSCGAKAPKGKFCIVCGMELTPKCPTCGRELPTGAKFCLDCGTKI